MDPGLIQKVAKSEMTEISPDAQILLQRYSQLRTEIMLRYEARYKLLRIDIMVAVASLGVIWTLKAFMLAFIGCIFMLGVGLLLFAEITFVSIIAGYLFQIEEELDEKFNIKIPGWERHLLHLRRSNPLMLRIQTISLILFIFFFYSLFNVLGCIGVEGTLRYIIFGIVELLIFAGVYIALKIVRKFYPYFYNKKHGISA
jgi:hypothetical protein